MVVTLQYSRANWVRYWFACVDLNPETNMRANTQPHTVHTDRTRLGAHPIIAFYDQIQDAVGGGERKLRLSQPKPIQPPHTSSLCACAKKLR